MIQSWGLHKGCIIVVQAPPQLERSRGVIVVLAREMLHRKDTGVLRKSTDLSRYDEEYEQESNADQRVSERMRMHQPRRRGRPRTQPLLGMTSLARRVALHFAVDDVGQKLEVVGKRG